MSKEFLLIAEHLTDRRIPTVSIEPARTRTAAPRVIVLHGLHSHKEKYLEELYLLAKRGFRAIAIDLALHGEREDAATAAYRLTTDFQDAMRAIIYDTAADISALIDLWGDETDGIGLYGVSAGGLAAHAAVVADFRIDAVVAIASSPDWTTADPVNRPLPGSSLHSYLAGVSPVNQTSAYPPTALLMLNGVDDNTISPEGSVLLHERLVPIYAHTGQSSRLQLKLFPGIGHSYIPEMRTLALNWMSAHLTKNNI